MINTTEEIILLLLKNALHPDGKAPEIINPDWADVLDTAKKQNFLALICDTASSYPSFAEFKAINSQYFKMAAGSVITQMNRTKAFLALYKAFLTAGLAPITMKGIICRNLYGEKAEFRPSGDEDILIEKKDYEKTISVLKSCGYQMEECPDKEMSLQEVTFHNKSLTVELHLNPFGSDSAVREKMNDWFRDVFSGEETIVFNGVPVRTMMPTDHFLFLVFHAFKHFTGGGFGVRMMTDLLLFAEKYGDRIDWTYVDKGLKAVGACGFLADLVEIGNNYLDFHLLPRYSSVCPEELLEDMFRMGTFGNTNDTDRTAGRIVKDTVQKGRRSDNKMSSYIRFLFPSFKTWCAWKPYLRDKPWMVIPEWFGRVGRYLKGEANVGDLNGLDKGYKIAKERITLLEKYGVL